MRRRTRAWKRRSTKPYSATSCTSRSRTRHGPWGIIWRSRGGIRTNACLGRLRTLLPGVQPLSRGWVSARDGVVDRMTGARGVIVQVTRLTWVHASAVDVLGGYYLTHRQAAGLRYRVEHDGRAWAVTVVHLLWRA